ncbi:MAG: ABC transporter permease [Desulfotomaculales bacterium]
MGSFILQRALQSVAVLLITSILSFALIYAVPGDPVNAIYGPKIQELRPEERERIRANLGLNQPIPVQYTWWLINITRGDMGISYTSGRPVATIIRERLPATFLLAGASSAIIFFLAIFLGVLTGLKRNSGVDHATTAISLTLASTPNFWLALMLILIFGVWLKVLPTAGMSTIGQQSSVADVLRHLILPACVLSFGHIGYYIRFVRAGVWEQLQLDYVLALRARGIKESTILYRHVLKNSLLPFVNYLGATIPVMLSGTVVVETVFAWPGLGQLSVAAATSRDYSLLMGTVMLAGVLVIAGNFLADLAGMLLDPRTAAGQLGRGAAKT